MLQAEAGKVSCHGDSTWSAIRSIQGSYQGLRPIPVTAIRDERGSLCETAEGQCQLWEQHFTKILNIESQYDPTVFDTLLVHPVSDGLADLPTMEELDRAVKQLAHRKAASVSGVLLEMIKYAGGEFFHALLALVHQVWREGTVPQAWRDAELVPVPKKGDLTVCDNWQGIARLDVVGK